MSVWSDKLSDINCLGGKLYCIKENCCEESVIVRLLMAQNLMYCEITSPQKRNELYNMSYV